MAAVDEPLPGGWTVSENSEITDNQKTMPEKIPGELVDITMTDIVME